MSYDYFNTSYLAFGAKLNKAFRSLAGALDSGYKNVDSLFSQVGYIDEYMNKNFRVPTPNNPKSPAQCDQVYDVLASNPIVDFNIEYTSTGGTIDGIKVSLIFFNSQNNKITTAENTSHTTLSGSIYLKLSGMYNVFQGEIIIRGENETGTIPSNTIKLFDFDVCPREQNIIVYNKHRYINNSIGIINNKVYDSSAITTRNDILNKPLPHRMFLLVRTKKIIDNFSLKVRYNNDTQDTEVVNYLLNSNDEILVIPLYLQKGDIIKSNNKIDTIFEVRYE